MRWGEDNSWQKSLDLCSYHVPTKAAQQQWRTNSSNLKLSSSSSSSLVILLPDLFRFLWGLFNVCLVVSAHFMQLRLSDYVKKLPHSGCIHRTSPKKQKTLSLSCRMHSYHYKWLITCIWQVNFTAQSHKTFKSGLRRWKVTKTLI